MPITLPPEVADTIRAYFPERGEQWLADLPATVEKRCADWGLELIGDAFRGGTHSFVAPVRRADGSVAVLKVPVVDVENQGEPTGLFHYDGDGAVRLYDYDRASGALLLEWARPGTPLLEQPGFPSLEGRPEHVYRIERACRLYRRLRREPGESPGDFPPLPEAASMVADWSVRFGEPESALAQAVPARLLEDAATLCGELGTPDGPLLIVNRDTHLGNIVAAEREPWLLIDPKPYLGEAAFDAGFLILIQVQSDPTAAHAAAVVARTADALGVAPRRARTWAFLRAMEEIAWSVEDDDRAVRALHLATAQALVVS
ncbi:aminoglycoside phosphotransferase family protein [Nocardia pseudobrasiliensis]|uniref:Streptomycin 6-kinase n=1 Tax=Nocardia pseudobrasiliensis TaxID=45979 RepID=A0A370IES6_9NOCA|nr:aminoglycoside phosphotransferase family protein [Nocardia pseudobrasiliensis]RDI69226.1 streptomycin 6-kinase [Nocardia pseudobrasiliensis]